MLVKISHLVVITRLLVDVLVVVLQQVHITFQSVQEQVKRIALKVTTSVSYTHLTLPTTPYV